jgi:hypothetical protein
VHAALGIGELHLIPGLEGPALCLRRTLRHPA